jgi:phosphoribosyl 1,2-cyclic phosphodiesterase
MRFASLGSGSRGNGSLVQAGRTCVLVDCGFSLRDTERRLARLGCAAAELSAILVTHEHSDHARGVAALASQYDVPVWMTHGTWSQVRADFTVQPRLFDVSQEFAIGDLHVAPYPVPHDAREPAQFVFSDGGRRLGLLTDAGCGTPHIERHLGNCHALMLECNHELDLLLRGSYPPSLVERIRGPWGHLSNAQAAEVLARLDHSRLQHVIAMHLSEKHNTPERARASLGAVLGCADEWIGVADQDDGLDWRQVF